MKLGDDKEIQVDGEKIVAINTTPGKTKLFHNVQYVPSLAHNLLSVGQLMLNGYSVQFSNKVCYINEVKTGRLVTKVLMIVNKMFPNEASNMEQLNMVFAEQKATILWHKRYGLLNVKILKLLNQKDFVQGLPKIDHLPSCEGCIYGKQSRKSFPSGASWRASTQLELTHADVCGPMQASSLGVSSYYILFTDDYT